MDYITSIIKKNNIKKFGSLKLKDNTINNNAKMILKINNMYGEEYKTKSNENGIMLDGDQEFYYNLLNIEKLLTKENYSVSTKRNYYSVLLQLLSYDRDFNDYKNDSYIEKYVNKIKEFQEKKSYNETNSLVSDKKKEQQVNMEFIQKLLVKLKKDDHIDIYTLISILLQFPIRTEIGNLKYITLKDYNKNKEKLTDSNWLVVGSKKISMVRNVYKTAHLYKQKINEITGNAKKVLVNYLKLKNISKNNEQIFGFMGEQSLSQRLFYLTTKYTGISLSVNSIAKITIANGLDELDMTDLSGNQIANKIRLYLMEIGEIRGTSYEILHNSYVN